MSCFIFLIFILNKNGEYCNEVGTVGAWGRGGGWEGSGGKGDVGGEGGQSTCLLQISNSPDFYRIGVYQARLSF